MEKILYKLPEFEGPLDLLLHLISKNKLNIYDIKISELLEQYMVHMALMEEQNLNVTTDFLEMAARLVYIKTVLLLPKHEEGEKLKEELTGQLLEYKECREIAKLMSEKINLDFISRVPVDIPLDFSYKNNHDVLEIFNSYIDVAGKRVKKLLPSKESFSSIVSKAVVSVFSRVIYVLRALYKSGEVKYALLFKSEKKSELIATFLAVLELMRSGKITVTDDKVKKVKLLNGGERCWKSKK